MSLSIVTSYLPIFFESLALTPLPLVLSGQAQGETYTWQLITVDSNGNTYNTLPAGLSLSPSGVISGTPNAISTAGIGTIAGTSGTRTLTLTITGNPTIQPSQEIIVGGVSYLITSITAVNATTYTLTTFTTLAATYTNSAYQIIPLGRMIAVNILVKVYQDSDSSIFTTRSYKTRVIKLGTPDSIRKYLVARVDTQNRILESEYLQIFDSLSTAERPFLSSLIEKHMGEMDLQTGTLKTYIQLKL